MKSRNETIYKWLTNHTFIVIPIWVLFAMSFCFYLIFNMSNSHISTPIIATFFAVTIAWISFIVIIDILHSKSKKKRVIK